MHKQEGYATLGWVQEELHAITQKGAMPHNLVWYKSSYMQ